MGMGRSVPGEGTQEERLGQDRPGYQAGSPERAWSVRAWRAEGRRLEPHSPQTRPSHPCLLCLPLPCNVKAIGPRPHFHPRPCPSQSDFLALTQNFSPRPPKPFSEDSLSMVPSPPYLVCFPSSPPPGQPGRYRCRHLGSGRWGRSLTSRGGASGEPGAGAPPPPSLPVLSW